MATVCGAVERINRLVTVRSLHGRYSAEIGDVVVGRVLEASSSPPEPRCLAGMPQQRALGRLLTHSRAGVGEAVAGGSGVEAGGCAAAVSRQFAGGRAAPPHGRGRAQHARVLQGGGLDTGAPAGRQLRRRAAAAAHGAAASKPNGDPWARSPGAPQAEVQSVHHDGTIMLHTRHAKFGKLRHGQAVSVPASLVKRQQRHVQQLTAAGGRPVGLRALPPAAPAP